MSRFFAIDVRDKIIDLLENGGVDSEGVVRKSLTLQLVDIDTARTMTTQSPNIITYKWGDNNYPTVSVRSTESELLQDEILTDDLEITPEIFTIEIVSTLKSRDETLHNQVENYIQAIMEILNGYEDTNITETLVTKTDKGEIYSDKNGFKKSGLVMLEVRIN